MLNWLFNLFNKDLTKHLNQTKKIRVSGIKFIIKKINTINYLEGAKVLKQTYDTYKSKGVDTSAAASDKKIIEHFSHVLVSGIVHPRIVYNNDNSGIPVESLFVDWDLVVMLYNEIMEFTYGKKKMKQLTSQGRDLLS